MSEDKEPNEENAYILNLLKDESSKGDDFEEEEINSQNSD